MAQNNKAMSLENTKQYVKGILQGWFSNKATLDKLSTATNGDLLYDNQPVGSGSGSTITVDDALSGTSENPVQNKVIYAALQNTGSIPYTLPPATTTDLGGIIVGDNLTIDANGRLSADEQSIILDIDEVDRYDPDTNELVLVDADGDVTRRIDLTPTGGYGSNVTVDDVLSDTSENPVQNKVIKGSLDSKQDTLTFDNAPTENSANPVTSGGVYAALQNQTTYELPIATSSILGGIKVGAGLEVDSNGVLKVVGFQTLPGYVTLSENNVALNYESTTKTISVLGSSGQITSVVSANENYATATFNNGVITVMAGNSGGETTIDIAVAENLPNYNANVVRIPVVVDKTKIVTWADGTDEEIAAMLAAHEQGKLNIYDHWNIGDKRKISLSAMDAIGVNESYDAQDVEIMLVDKDVVDLASGGKCTFVWQQANLLNNLGTMNSTSTNVGGWRDCSRRTWCNNVYYNALPSGFKLMLKEASIKSAAGGGSSELYTTSDKIFFPCANNVFGTSNSNLYLNEDTVHWNWYARGTAYRLKGVPSGNSYSMRDWFTRSASKSGQYQYIATSTSGTAYAYSSSGRCYFAPCGCI